VIASGSQRQFAVARFGDQSPVSLIDCTSDEAGNLYVLGWFAGPTDFDPGGGSDLRIPVGNSDVYLTKLDPRGKYAWTCTWGQKLGEGIIGGTGVACDPQGNVFVGGSFHGRVDLDPGTGADIRGVPQDIHGQGFIVKLTGDGAYEWGRVLDAKVASLDAGSSDGVCFAGSTSFSDDAFEMLSGGTPSFVPPEVAVGAVKQDGSLSWCHLLPAENELLGGWGMTVAFNKSGEVCVAGFFSGELDLGEPNQPLVAANSVVSGFLAKYSSIGQLIWADSLSGDLDSVVTVLSLAPDDAGNVYLSGWFGGTNHTVDFDPGPGVENRTGSAVACPYVLKVNSEGSFQWVRTWEASGPEDKSKGSDVTIDDAGIMWLAGSFNGSFDFRNVEESNGEPGTTKAGAFLLTMNANGEEGPTQLWYAPEKTDNLHVTLGHPGDVILGGTFSSEYNFNPGFPKAHSHAMVFFLHPS
jgi:hypothetical protein